MASWTHGRGKISRALIRRIREGLQKDDSERERDNIAIEEKDNQNYYFYMLEGRGLAQEQLQHVNRTTHTRLLNDGDDDAADDVDNAGGRLLAIF